MFDPLTILTVRDVAAYLQTSEHAVIELIESGEISSFNVAGEPRIQAGSLISWFQSEMRLQELNALKRALESKQTWSAALQEDPELRQQIEKTEYKKDSFGAFLKAALNEPARGSSLNQRKRKQPPISPPVALSRLDASQAPSTDYLARLRSRPVTAFLVAVTVAVIGIGAFTEALTKVSAFLTSLIERFQ